VAYYTKEAEKAQSYALNSTRESRLKYDFYDRQRSIYVTGRYISSKYSYESKSSIL
jgi:hypothetical protein